MCVLALVLEYTLQRLLRNPGCAVSTPSVFADLERVQSVPLTVGDRHYLCRTPLVGHSATVFPVIVWPSHRALARRSATVQPSPRDVAIFSTFMSNASPGFDTHHIHTNFMAYECTADVMLQELEPMHTETEPESDQ
ncbi:MAG: hypothetical protein OWU84_04810 [Firmicutes bacterium]|nr:hypothetical protein [Bacillota bacterium]